MSAHKANEKKGLRIIAIHRGEGSNEEIAWTAAARKWPWPVYRDGNVKDFSLGGNPQIFVFDDKGQAALAPGGSGDLLKVIAAEAGEASDWILGAQKFTKFAAQAKDVQARKNLGKILAEMLEKANSADEQEKSEAAAISEKLQRYASSLEAFAVRLIEDGKPSQAAAVRKTLAEQFKDSEPGKRADEQIAKDNEEAAWKNELEAEKIWKAVEPALYKLRPPAKDADAEQWKKKNAAAIKTISEKLTTIKDKFGGTKAFAAYEKRVAWLTE